MKKASILAIALTLELAGLSACATRVPVASSVESGAGQAMTRPVVGKVDFGPLRQVQTTVGQAVSAATVALLDPTSGDPVTTAVTSSGGLFEMNFSNNFIPQAGQVYLLEAYKGLADNAVGSPAVRVRTLMTYKYGSWQSLASASLLVSPETTALCILASIQGLNQNTLFGLLGTLAPDPGSLSGLTYQPPVNAQIKFTDYQTVVGEVYAALETDQDPVSAISFDGWNYVSVPQGSQPSPQPDPSPFASSTISPLPMPTPTL